MVVLVGTCTIGEQTGWRPAMSSLSTRPGCHRLLIQSIESLKGLHLKSCPAAMVFHGASTREGNYKMFILMHTEKKGVRQLKLGFVSNIEPKHVLRVYEYVCTAITP